MRRVFFPAVYIVLAAFVTTSMGLLIATHRHRPAGDPVVQVVASSGSSGTAFHIGGGVFLTAKHVVPEGVEYKSGDEAAKVMWRAATEDVAAVYVPSLAELATLEVRCSPLRIGEKVTLTGYSGDLGRLTVTGEVIGSKTFPVLGEVVMVTASTIPGMSGGAVVDSDGRVVGIIDALYLAAVPSTAGALRTPYPIGFIKPATIFCPMIGRKLE